MLDTSPPSSLNFSIIHLNSLFILIIKVKYLCLKISERCLSCSIMYHVYFQLMTVSFSQSIC